jgi:PAS domain S-box-containing protein
MRDARKTRPDDAILLRMVDLTPAALVVVDTYGRFTYVNPAACELFGCRADEMLGRNFAEILVEGERDEMTAYLCSPASHQPGRRSLTVLRPDGERREVQFSHITFEGGGELLLAGTFHDATENRRVQRQAIAISQAAAGLAVTRSLTATLDALAQSVVEATSAKACGVYLLDTDGHLRTAGTFGLPEGYAAAADAASTLGAPRTGVKAIETRALAIDENIISRRLADPRFAPVHDLIRNVPWDIVVSVPLLHQDKAVGALSAYYPPDGGPSEIEMAFLRSMAYHAASAALYARLLAASSEKVALEERQRLARDLHDSVSQAVYGIALAARSAQELLAKDPALVQEPLEYLLRLSEAALTEMRALIFELRPEALAREGLTGALKHHTAALRARHGITVEESLGVEPGLSFDSKQALYRIAQEALHNAARHARAKRVVIALKQIDSQIRLEVSDDGVGFDSRDSQLGHFGLNTMRERATGLGGTLEIDSRPGAGTTVRAIIPTKETTLHH